MIKGQKASDETKLNMSKSHKGAIPWNKGKPCSFELKLKISKSLIGLRKGIKQTPEHLKNRAESKRNGQWFECLTCSKKFYRSKIHISKGDCKYCSRECFQQSSLNKAPKPYISEFRKRMTGDKSPSWRGGITPINIKIRSSDEYKNWRISVFKRDNYVCQYCGATNIYFQAHHIKSFSKYSELRFDVDNGITLCKACHKKTDTYAKNIKYQNV